MKSIEIIKKQKEQKVSEIIKECLVFFAFSNEQFEKNKTQLQEGEKYVAMGAGGYMPKSKVAHWIEGGKKIDAWYKDELKANKARKANILYELNNHEAFYTNDIEDALLALGEDYTAVEVKEVFHKERKKLALANKI